MNLELLRGSHNILNIFKIMKYKIDFIKDHPNYFEPEGLMIFCGSQGSGKTLSAVQYCGKCLDRYEKAVFCTNVEIKQYPINCYYNRRTEIVDGIENDIIEYYTILGNELVRQVVLYRKNDEDFCTIKDYDVIGFNGRIVIEYDGLDCLKELYNGEQGVLYLIDEIHLEFNSLESKNIPIDVMIEVSQQRKQRKQIVGTSQVYMRMAKPLREQIKNVVICRKFFGFLQFNRLVDGQTSYEQDGKLCFETQKRLFWLHSPELYSSYDTFKKMRRYRNEWKGVSNSNIYDTNVVNINNVLK